MYGSFLKRAHMLLQRLKGQSQAHRSRLLPHNLLAAVLGEQQGQLQVALGFRLWVVAKGQRH